MKYNYWVIAFQVELGDPAEYFMFTRLNHVNCSVTSDYIISERQLVQNVGAQTQVLQVLSCLNTLCPTSSILLLSFHCTGIDFQVLTHLKHLMALVHCIIASSFIFRHSQSLTKVSSVWL